jgi:hypothetical protein
MKRLGIISTAIMLLSLGSVASAYSLQEKQEEKAPPPKQQEQAKPAAQPKQQAPPKQQAAKPAAQPKQQAQKTQDTKETKPPATVKTQPVKSQPAASKTQPVRTQPTAAKTQPVKTQPATAKGQPAKTQQTQQSGQHVVRTSAEVSKQNSAPALRLSARGSGRIPDDRFRASFGSGHNFRIGSPVMVGGFSRFQYGGFWFGFVDPWPMGWYYTDNVYIDYVDGGYFLYDPYYPGARMSISVVI